MFKHTFKYLALLALPLTMINCGKDDSSEVPHFSVDQLAMVKFYNSALGSPVVGVYLDGARVNNTTAYATAFPSVVAYMAVSADSKEITAADTSATAKFTHKAPLSLQAGKYYSAILVDSITKANWLVVEDVIANPKPTDSIARIRLGNILYNGTNGIEVISRKLQKTIVGPVAPKAMSAFVEISKAPYTDTLYVRDVVTQKYLDTVNTVTFGNSRSYTLLLRGIPGAYTGTHPMTLVTYTNR
ncbi:DUF4397 domain-containing protein [Chitinophaga lutea]